MPIVSALIFIGTLIAAGAFSVTVTLLLLDYVSERRRFKRSLQIKLLSVLLPKVGAREQEKTQESQQHLREVISVIEQFLASLYAIERERKKALRDVDHLTFEIAALHGEIRFYIAVPDSIVDLVEKQLHSIYSDAVIEAADEYNIYLPKTGFAQAATFKFKKGAEYPLRTYQQIETDPLNVLTNTVAKVGRDEAAIVQICFRAAKPGVQKKGDELAKALQEGKQTIAGKKFGAEFKDIMTTKGAGAPKEPQKPQTPLVEEAVKAIESKASKVSFEVNVRVAAGAPTPEQAKVQVRNLTAAFEQFAFPNLNNLVPVVPNDRGEQAALLAAVSFRTFSPVRALLMSSEELGSFMHFPDSRYVETPNIVWLGARTAAAPAQLPKEGRLIGFNVHRGVRRPFYLPREDRRRHFYNIGKTGTGKTTLLINMIRQDIEDGEGVAYLDPRYRTDSAVDSKAPCRRCHSFPSRGRRAADGSQHARVRY